MRPTHTSGGGPPLLLSGKEFSYKAGAAIDMGSIPGSGRSSEEINGKPSQYPCLENPMDKRSLADYSP